MVEREHWRGLEGRIGSCCWWSCSRWRCSCCDDYWGLLLVLVTLLVLELLVLVVVLRWPPLLLGPSHGVVLVTLLVLVLLPVVVGCASWSFRSPPRLEGTLIPCAAMLACAARGGCRRR